jgi:hypothetical protein
MLNDQITREIRTWIPIAVGVGLTFLSRALGLVIDEATSAAVTLLFVGIAQALYHLIAAELEQHVWSGFGWLLGVPKSKTDPRTLSV